MRRVWRRGECAISVLVVFASACATSDFNAEELHALDELLPAAPAADPSNAWADAAGAAALGQQLFFDPRFSGPIVDAAPAARGGLGQPGQEGLVSCASCHDPAHGGADRRSLGATSIAARVTDRNAPSVLNAALARTWFFSDGRKDSLWSQALAPIESQAEHNFSRLQVAHLIHSRYRASYEALFGPMPALDDVARFPAEGAPGTPSFDAMAAEDRRAVNHVFASFGKAVAAYERRLVGMSSPFSRALAGEHGAMDDAQVRGGKLFVGRAACNECHRGPRFSDDAFHNDGVPQVGEAVPSVDEGRAAGIAKVLADEFGGGSEYSDRPSRADLDALQLASPAALGAFKTPTLRNVALTAPYMHTGGIATLAEVVAFYRFANSDSGFVGTRDARLQPLRLSDDEADDLVRFLEALTDDPLPAELVSPPRLP